MFKIQILQHIENVKYITLKRKEQSSWVKDLLSSKSNFLIIMPYRI